MKTAKFLFIGGPWDGEIKEMDIDLREMVVQAPIPGTEHGMWVEDERAPRWLRWFGRIFPSYRPCRWVVSVDVSRTVYRKRQAVHPKRESRSIPVFVEKSIADGDRWLEELPTAVVDALWTEQTTTGSPTDPSTPEQRKLHKRTLLKDRRKLSVATTPQRRCWNCKKGIRRGRRFLRWGKKPGKAKYVYCRKRGLKVGTGNCCESYKRAW